MRTIFATKLGIVVAISYFLGVWIAGLTLPLANEIGGLWSVIVSSGDG